MPAQDKPREIDGKLIGGIPDKQARSTSLADAVQRGLNGKHDGAGAYGENLASNDGPGRPGTSLMGHGSDS